MLHSEQHSIAPARCANWKAAYWKLLTEYQCELCDTTTPTRLTSRSYILPEYNYLGVWQCPRQVEQRYKKYIYFLKYYKDKRKLDILNYSSNDALTVSAKALCGINQRVSNLYLYTKSLWVILLHFSYKHIHSSRASNCTPTFDLNSYLLIKCYTKYQFDLSQRLSDFFTCFSIFFYE